MEPEKLKYNIRDFAVATCEKKKAAHLSPVRYLNGYLLTQQKAQDTGILIVCKDTKKKSNYASNRLIISAFLRN